MMDPADDYLIERAARQEATWRRLSFPVTYQRQEGDRFCSACDGTGMISEDVGFSNGVMANRPCSKCHGLGCY